MRTLFAIEDVTLRRGKNHIKLPLLRFSEYRYAPDRMYLLDSLLEEMSR